MNCCRVGDEKSRVHLSRDVLSEQAFRDQPSGVGKSSSGELALSVLWLSREMASRGQTLSHLAFAELRRECSRVVVKLSTQASHKSGYWVCYWLYTSRCWVLIKGRGYKDSSGHDDQGWSETTAHVRQSLVAFCPTLEYLESQSQNSVDAIPHSRRCDEP